MLVKTYYSTGHFDVFDTATLVDGSIFIQTPTGGSSEEYWSMGESLNQPSSVQDDGPMGCKLLL